MNRTDATFLKHFTQIIVALAGITLVLIIVAWIAHGRFYGDAQPLQVSAESRPAEKERHAAYLAVVESRTRPVGAYLAGEAGVARKQALAEAAAKAAAAACAYDCTQDGSVVYARLCSACHDTGAGGAPKMLAVEWTARQAQGLETLVKHAIEGYDGPAETVMPPRGNNPALTDEQIHITVQYMLDNLK